ncbi:HemK methyltransferase member 2 [Cichlidogyrus casuarinus]|uniref:HemK methyltransferase member 2 n=1 Tax=Cichlidogyrus casuarinus TaxID=1844966 RepID=A0ABD2Q496_9PLAT
MLPTPDVRTNENVYEPGQDSFLFLDALESELPFLNTVLKPTTIFEFGPGSGIISLFLSQNMSAPAFFHLCDINIQACLLSKENFEANSSKAVDCICCDLSSPLSDSFKKKVDLIIFNPPYVPTTLDEFERSDDILIKSWSGGPCGRIVIDQFVEKCLDFLSVNGCLYLLLVKENLPNDVNSLILTRLPNFEATLILKRRCANELLYVFKYAPKIYPS